MVFASPIFLFLFLPLVLTAYFALPRHWGNTALLVASIVFYVWGEGRLRGTRPRVGGFQLDRGRPARRRGSGLAPPLARAGCRRQSRPAGIFKYANFTVANFDAAARALHWGTVALVAIPLPQLDTAPVERLQPNIVVEEIVERTLNLLAAFPMRR